MVGNKYIKGIITFIIVLFFITGCGTSIKNLSNLGKSSKFQETKSAKTKKEYKKLYQQYKEENKTNDLLWDYEVGIISYYSDAFKDSVFYFDEAEKLIKKYDEEVLANKVLSNVGGILSNDTFMDYRPRIYEKIMVNTYKAIDFIQIGDFQNARIEFNRALVRQDRAKEFFEKEIALEKKKINSENKKKLKEKNKKIPSLNKIVKNKKTLDPIEKKYTNLFAFKAYRDFNNPFTTYLAGIFFLNTGDYRKATDLLKESYGMIKNLESGSKYVLKDFKLADSLKSSLRKRKKHYTWVIFFNGKGPKKEELKIDIPLFLFTNDVYYTGIALPTLKMNDKAYDYLVINRKYKTKTIASMDRIVKTEFKKRFPTIMMRALTRTVVQTIIQKQIGNKLEKGMALAGPMGYILAKGAAAATQYALNRADTRIWERLPKEFQVVRINSTKNIQITTPNKKNIISLKTKPNRNYIIFVTIASSDSEPIVTYQEFK